MFREYPVLLSLLAFGCPSLGIAQSPPATTGSLNVEYQYQLHYQRPWLNYPGPGLSLGGTLPEQGRDGISSFYGLPFPAPLGTGVYVNNPLAYGHTAVQPQLYGPGPIVFSGPIGPYPDPWSASRQKSSNSPHFTQHSRGGGHRLVKPIAAQIDATRPVVASNGDAVRRSLEQEVLGDKKLRLRKWSEACAYYRQSVDAADDRARVHLRLGFAYVALNHFTLAQREFKRGLALDPAIANDGDNLATIFGPESDPIRKSIQQQIAAWVRNDIRDADRLFLLGLWLHYDDDPRSREVLEAALNRAGEASHIAALLRPSNESSREYDQARLATAPELPTLNTIPVPVDDEDHSHSQLDLSQQVQTLPPPPPPLADDGQ